MWAKVESGNVTDLYNSPQNLTIDGVKHSFRIFETWSSGQLRAINIYEVEHDDTNFKDPKYYINTSISYNFDGVNNKVISSYGTANARNLDDELYSAQDETDGLGTEGDVKNRGLKYQFKDSINGEARNRLSETDWMVLREADSGTAIPSNIKTHRAAIRTKANEMCDLIDNSPDVEHLANLYQYVEGSDGKLTRPLGEFPIL